MKKALITSVLSATLLTGIATSTVMTSAVASNASEQQIYRNGDFGRLAQTLRSDLSRQGYQVMDIKADTHNNNSALKVYAKKNNKGYELTYSYPNLKLLKNEQKAWSQLWQDKNSSNRHHNNSGNQHHGNKHYGKNDVKDSIKRDANLNTIMAKAERKLKNMGYKIDEIEVDDYQNKGILKADVDRGDKEYEIRLSYPGLQILTIEED
ncbi:PepSY domain-containing protein [Psychrobacter arenosus]|uniref:PepSY domain-containing protein n=1 Tax=Psychrobacter arenosus TaxID=256326 RepID=UPI001917C4D7|nr:PepSY domain-containing protein [Psychrobacter arenosus]